MTGHAAKGASPAAATAEQEVVTVDLPAPQGWVKKYTPRKAGTPRRNEIVFIAPTGEEIKSKKQLEQYLRSHSGGPPSSEFDWGTGDTPRRSARISEKVKATESPEGEPPKKRERKSTSKKGSRTKKETEVDENMAPEHGDAGTSDMKGNLDEAMKEAEDKEEPSVDKTKKADVAPVEETKDDDIAPVEEAKEDMAPVEEAKGDVDIAPVEETKVDDMARVEEIKDDDMTPIEEIKDDDMAPIEESKDDDMAPVEETKEEAPVHMDANREASPDRIKKVEGAAVVPVEKVPVEKTEEAVSLEASNVASPVEKSKEEAFLEARMQDSTVETKEVVPHEEVQEEAPVDHFYPEDKKLTQKDSFGKNEATAEGITNIEAGDYESPGKDTVDEHATEEQQVKVEKSVADSDVLPPSEAEAEKSNADLSGKDVAVPENGQTEEIRKSMPSMNCEDGRQSEAAPVNC